ncbi:MAG: RNA 2',3'-cyclic phosphodiesterase [Dehalococcoidales bacterium]
MEIIRAFIAIELPQSLKEELAKLQEKLKANTSCVKWVSPDSIHLTLKFLGDIEKTNVNLIASAMDEAARKISPFSLCVGELGAFPNSRRIQVVWVGLEGASDTLDKLYLSLESEAEKIGFPPEKKAFKPHLTLGRIGMHVSESERQKFGELVQKSSANISYTFEAADISLMQSTLTPQGAIYNRLHKANFTGADYNR